MARFGTLLEESTRGSDLAVRYGGEEFLLLLSQVSAEQAQGLVERVAQTWSAESELTFSAASR
ncbi:MAG: diguanylate cyclase [Pseudonocardiales bacterium]|nr:diguanylate cyclase [Pseudonocardiales bacterium]